MDHDFKGLMSKKTDDELITILTVRRQDYAETAISAAQTEFEKRGIPHHQIDKVTQEQTIIKEKETERANEPLDSDTKTLAFILPIIAHFMYAEKFRNGGYERKLAEMGKMYWRGRFMYICLLVILIIAIKSCS
jgi:hypothetical protein